LWCGRQAGARQPGVMEGRVPSRPAVFHGALLVEMELDLPFGSAFGRYACGVVVKQVLDNLVLWRAGFHPGLRRLMALCWSRWNSTFLPGLRLGAMPVVWSSSRCSTTWCYGGPGSIPACGVSWRAAGRDGTRPSFRVCVWALRLWCGRQAGARQPGVMEGRVPSRPAASHGALLVEMELDLPSRPASGRYACGVVVKQVLDNLVLWRAGFHPGLRCFMARCWSRWNSTFLSGLRLGAMPVVWSSSRCSTTWCYGGPGSIPACGVSWRSAGRDGTRPSFPACVWALCLWCGRQAGARQPGVMEGRVPSRPAVFHGALLVEMELDLPFWAAFGRYACGVV